MCAAILTDTLEGHETSEQTLEAWLENADYNNLGWTLVVPFDWYALAIFSGAAPAAGQQILKTLRDKGLANHTTWGINKTLVEAIETGAGANTPSGHITSPKGLGKTLDEMLHEGNAAGIGARWRAGDPVAKPLQQTWTRQLADATRKSMLGAEWMKTATICMATGTPYSPVTQHGAARRRRSIPPASQLDSRYWATRSICADTDGFTWTDERWTATQLDGFKEATADWTTQQWTAWLDLIETCTDLNAGDTIQLVETMLA